MRTRLQRIQRKRSKGWRLPANTVCVTRPGKWGNPFRVGGWFRWEDRAGWSMAGEAGASGYVEITDRATAVAWFERWLRVAHLDLTELRGKNLACWCRPGEPCHGDVLLRFANRRATVAK